MPIPRSHRRDNFFQGEQTPNMPLPSYRNGHQLTSNRYIDCIKFGKHISSYYAGDKLLRVNLAKTCSPVSNQTDKALPLAKTGMHSHKPKYITLAHWGVR